MSDALPLPSRPNIEQYKKLAKDFQSACKSPEPSAIQRWVVRWAESIAPPELREELARMAPRIEKHWRKALQNSERAGRCTLADAQFFLARAHGFPSWPAFTRHVEALASADSTD